jgi:hypothetical protein
MAETPSQTQATSEPTPAPTPAPSQPSVKPKSPPSQKKLESLAKARAAKAERKAGKVVRNDESAEELVERAKTSDPDVEVTKRTKRKSYEGRESSSGNGLGSTAKYVLGAAVVAGLAYLGTQKGMISIPGAASAPTPGKQQPPAGTQPPQASQPILAHSLSTDVYYV